MITNPHCPCSCFISDHAQDDRIDYLLSGAENDLQLMTFGACNLPPPIHQARQIQSKQARARVDARGHDEKGSSMHMSGVDRHHNTPVAVFDKGLAICLHSPPPRLSSLC